VERNRGAKPVEIDPETRKLELRVRLATEDGNRGEEESKVASTHRATADKAEGDGHKAKGDVPEFLDIEYDCRYPAEESVKSQDNG
jgi:hypothetical protein